MALVRCQQHGHPKGRTADYVDVPAEPVGHPDSGVICGLKDCDNPGLVWLTREEYAAYQDGERIFGLATYAVKIKVR